MAAIENTVCYLQAPRKGKQHGRATQGKATQQAGRSVRKMWVLLELMFILCGCSSQDSFYQALGICFLSLSFTLFLREEDQVPDHPAGPFPMLKPSLILSTPLAPQPPNVGDKTDRKKRGSQVCSVTCYSRLFLPAYCTQCLQVGNFCSKSQSNNDLQFSSLFGSLEARFTTAVKVYNINFLNSPWLRIRASFVLWLGILRCLRIFSCAVQNVQPVQISRNDASKKILLTHYKYLEDSEYFEDIKGFQNSRRGTSS